MATTDSPMVVGVFRDRALVEHAVKELRHAGFRDDEIQVWRQDSSPGGFLESLLHTWSGHETKPGEIADSLEQLGVTNEEADYYLREVEAGRSIVAVRSYGHQQEAGDILHRAGAYDAHTSLTHDLYTVPLREEVLTPQTQSIEVGAVYIRKEVITEEKTITVTVQREEVVIEHRSLASQGSPTDNMPGPGTLYELAPGQTIRIPIREEQIFLEKRPIVTHELIVGKHTVQEMQRFTDTVRREVPFLERQGEVIVHSSGLEERSLQGESSADV
ncbi:MAG TPA: YsnF/AvaK domain-containing protein [Ktedonobacteraceae bacterium]|nr:YsnF/AvaK domain-containing protein [Ktedonobacteraceae bacterium]